MGVNFYKLVGKAAVKCTAKEFDDAARERHLAVLENERDPWYVNFTKINEDCYVSTVFLGMDHNISGSGAPHIFETMVFGGPRDQHVLRCGKWSTAETQHDLMVLVAQESLELSR